MKEVIITKENFFKRTEEMTALLLDDDSPKEIMQKIDKALKPYKLEIHYVDNGGDTVLFEIQKRK